MARFWAWVMISSASVLAHAQPEPPVEQPELVQARSAFEEGVRAFRDGRPSDAKRAFQRSLDLYPTPVAAWNLARCTLQLGSPLEALQTTRDMLDERFGSLDDEQRAAAVELQREITATLALVRLRSQEPVPLRVTIDATDLGVLSPRDTLDHRVTPGAHVVRATARDARQFEHRVELAAGEQLELSLTLQEVETPSRKGLVWGVVGGVVGAVALAVILGFVLSNRQSREVDPVWGNIEALHAAP